MTIKDVARIARVTPQTVSRALRDAPDIAASTKTRVLEIAANLNYVKNSTASALRRGSTRLIAIIYDNLINLYFSIMTDFIQFSLKELGYSTLTMPFRHFRLNEEAYRPRFLIMWMALSASLNPKNVYQHSSNVTMFPYCYSAAVPP